MAHGPWNAGLESRYHREMAHGTFPDFNVIENKISDKIFARRRVRYIYWKTNKDEMQGLGGYCARVFNESLPKYSKKNTDGYWGSGWSYKILLMHLTLYRQ